jgi:hypothetical protein
MAVKTPWPMEPCTHTFTRLPSAVRLLTRCLTPSSSVPILYVSNSTFVSGCSWNTRSRCLPAASAATTLAVRSLWKYDRTSLLCGTLFSSVGQLHRPTEAPPPPPGSPSRSAEATGDDGQRCRLRDWGGDGVHPHRGTPWRCSMAHNGGGRWRSNGPARARVCFRRRGLPLGSLSRSTRLRLSRPLRVAHLAAASSARIV